MSAIAGLKCRALLVQPLPLLSRLGIGLVDLLLQ
jgi:hypothetical protein